MSQNPEDRLARLTKLRSHEIGLLREGVSFESSFSRDLWDLICQVSADRLALAKQFLAMAEILRRSRNDLSRATIARYYYAMYHAMRAVSFFTLSGDDHEDHSKLYKGIPNDYPEPELVANNLKNARLWRNEADYEPYPSDPSYFKSITNSLRPVAEEFVDAAHCYLKNKGNPYS